MQLAKFQLCAQLRVISLAGGSAQGNIISPIIANIYMHNALMLWYKVVMAKDIKGDNFLTVYADYWSSVNLQKVIGKQGEKVNQEHLIS